MIDLVFPGAVERERDFYGRSLEQQRLERALRVGREQSVIILGERRIGKTSLLNWARLRLSAWASAAGAGYRPLLLPTASTMRSLEQYALEILWSLCRSLNRSPRQIGLIDDDERLRFVSVSRFTDALAQLMDGVAPTHFVLCIDEFDAILVNCSPADALEVLGLTDHLLQFAGLPLTLCLTLTRLPETIVQTYHSPVIGKTDPIVLLPFTPDEMGQMVRGVLQDEVRLEDSALDGLYD